MQFRSKLTHIKMWALFSGFAFGIAAAVAELTGSDTHQDIGSVKTAAIKLFGNLESHGQGVFYFSESKDETSQGGGALAATWAVLRGSAALAAVLPVNLKVEKEKVFGIANFLLRTGLALSPTEAFYQLDSLSVLEDYRPAVPIIVQPSSILSLNSNNNLEVCKNSDSSFMQFYVSTSVTSVAVNLTLLFCKVVTISCLKVRFLCTFFPPKVI
jgi:hypothetical protein